MNLDMALGSAAPTSFQHRCGVTTALILIVCVALTKSAPTTYDEMESKRTDLADYFNDPNGCYYNYQHYEEGDRIVTNEPCLNCTCHNRMLMCYLRVCPFSKAIGQDCTVQKSPDQCCPVISCPEVPVHLLTSSTTPTPTTTTEIGWHDNYGCMMDENEFFPDGAQVPPNPEKPCELCYCIRNRTACIMQECTLHVEGCRPVYHEGVCCPIRYDCDYESEKSTTSAPQISGGLVFSTTSAPFDCRVNDDVYRDGESIAMVSEKPCEHCYCMRGDIVCAVQDCGEPLRGKDCTPETPPAGQCCPTSYQCANETNNSYDMTTLQPVLLSDSDENEAEKFPINEDIYNKLGENQPTSEQDEGNDVESEHTVTTPPENHNTIGETNNIPESDSVNNFNDKNKQETSSATPNLTNQDNFGTEPEQANYDTTYKPDEPILIDTVQPTQLPASDPSTNENAVSPSTQTVPNKDNNVKVGEENNSNEIPDKDPTHDDHTSNLPVSSTENKQEEAISGTEIPKVENEPTEQNKPVVDITSGAENQQESDKAPIEQNNQDSPQSENVSVTEIPKAENEPTEQNKPVVDITSGAGNQQESDKTPIEQNNQDNPQSENVPVTEIPKVENEPVVDSTSGAQNQPESSTTSVNQINQDNSQSENVSPTEIPQVENEPTEQNKPVVDIASGTGNQPESDNTPVEQINQGSPQSENVSPTEIPQVENEPTEQNKPVVDIASGTGNQPESDNTPVEQINQGSPQSDNVSPTEITSTQNEPTEQNKPVVDSTLGTENQPESDKTPIEQDNQSSPQSGIVSPTEIPQVENESTEQNKPVDDGALGTGNILGSDKTPVEQINQDSPVSENVSPTEIPTTQNEPTEQNKPVIDSTSGTGNQPESDKIQTEQDNQGSPQSENVSPTEIPKVENEPTEQNKPVVDNASGTENQPESDKTPVEQINQDRPQSENVSPTEIPNAENEPTEQNKPVIDSISGVGNQPESDKTQTEQDNQGSPQSGNVSPTEIPQVENEPTEQNKPTVESTSGIGNQPDKTQSEQNNHDSIQSENVSQTEIPSKQSENKIPESNPIQTVAPVASENDASTEQPNEENNIFVVSPTSPPLFSDNQVKVEQSPSIINENNTNDKTVEVPKPSADDKTSVTENTDTANKLPETHTELVTESQNVDENNKNSINIKPVDNNVNSVARPDTPVNSHDQLPAIAEHNDNRFGSNNPVSLEPVFTPTTEINYDVNTEVINHDPASQENLPIDVHQGEENENAPNADSVNQQITHQTETPTESEVSTNNYQSSADEQANYVTTTSPQQQIDENNIHTVHPQVINPGEQITTQDETKKPNDELTNGSFDQSSEKYVPTESPVLHSIHNETPEQNNQYESVTSQVQSLDENVNEIVDQTSVYPDTSSDEKNNLVTSTASYLNNGENVQPSSDKVEAGLNSQVSDEKPVKNTNEDVSVESATIQTISGNIDNNADNLVTTNNYADLPSTDAPGSQIVENEGSSPANPSNTVETNVNNDRPENVVPQISSNEAPTQHSEDDSSTNSPIQESPNVNIINDVEASTNVPYQPESPNDIIQDPNTESEVYTTQSSIDEQTLNVNGKPSEDSQNADKPLVSKTPDYVIDITTSVYSESSNTPELIITNEPVDSISEITTFNVDKNSDVVTESYENVQPGVPGEGSCLIDFVTYAHKAEVPKSNPCHEKCECLNSIVTCTSVNCPPAPPQHRNCIPLHPGNESWCCPTYMCEGGIEGMLFDSHNQLGSPQLISTVVLEDKPSEGNDEKPQTDDEVSSTTSPQISQEYNTLAPSQFDSNSNINSEGDIGVTEVPANTEIPYKPVEDFVATDNENNSPVTAVNLETIENEKPANNDKPEENNKPIENDQLTENNKPTEIDQPIENPKPIENIEADSTTISYGTDDQSITNKPETLNNNEEQNVLHNTVNESQDYLAPSTQVPENYEPAVTNVLPTSDQNRPEQNSESDVSISVTTYKPSDSILNQQQVDTDNKASEEANNAPTNEDSNTNPTAIVTELPLGEINPSEVGTQTPTIIADEKPMISGNNVDGLRPTSIDDIISSVYLVKDSVKNSLETSSKPTETSVEEVGLFEDSHQSTIVPENSSPDQYNNESQTTVSSVDSAPETQKINVINEILPENPSSATEANISLPSENAADGLAGVTQIPNISPQYEVNSAEQGVSTDLPSNGPEVEATVDDSKTPVESPTTQNLPSSGEQDLTDNNGPETPSNPILTQIQNAGEPSTDSSPPEIAVVVDDNKTPETSVPLTEQHEVSVDDIVATVKPAAEEKPDDVNIPITSDSDVPAEVLTQSVVTGRPVVSTPNGNDNRFGEPSSSSFRPPVHVGDDNNHGNEHQRPETGDAVHIPLDTETPAFNPSTNAPLANYPQKPSYTPIPQSTWTQKPFHQDSTSEAPLQPDQGYPDEYEDENEAVYGPGTCRYGGKVYVSAQQVPRDDPCDFCFCFRGDIICLQQSCPPPIFGCYQENIQGFCCPRYECPVAQATSVNVTTTTTSTTTMVPPHFFANAYRGAARRTGCLIHGHAYRVGEDVGIASGPCLECICGSDGKMKCDPKPCSPEPLLRKMMAEAVEQKKR